ncbi:MAG: TonB family protein [Gemmatimonadetes bacterium]|nr:TonB family protein [Gemmatimonadota bacterium]
MPTVAAIGLILGAAGCRTMVRTPAQQTPPPPPPAQAEGQTPLPDDEPSPEVAAIIDSIRIAVRDSIEAAARRDSIVAAARRDSIQAAARDSAAAAARRDSIDAAARRDSIAAQARRDSIAVAARDSIREAAIRDSIEAVRAATPAPADLETLRELGPAYIPYDESPVAVWDTERQANLTTTLLPVVRSEGLEARTRTYLWLLVTAEGRVDRVVIQTSSGSDAFDARARDFALRMEFRPARRGGRAVPAWVVRDISLVM